LFAALEADAPNWGPENSYFAESKNNSQVIGFILNGTHLDFANLHVTHSKDETDPESGLAVLNNSFIFNNMAERVGFEFTRKRSFNNIERTAGNGKQWKAVVSSANGSQTDHGSCPSEKCQPRWPQNLRFSIETGPIGMACVGDRVSTSAWQ
jgi:hypothetical protein